MFDADKTRMIGSPYGETRSSAVAERPRDALCLSVVSFNIPTAEFFITSYCGFRFTSAYNSTKFCSAVSYCLRRCGSSVKEKKN